MANVDFEEIFAFLSQCHWIHDLQLTKFFETKVWENFPIEWNRILSMTVEELNALPFCNTRESTASLPDPAYQTPLPDSLATFLQKSSSFSIARQQARETLPQPTVVGKELCKGMSPKKRHEVEWMASLVHQVASRAGCSIIVDVGSGLGYLGQTLHKNYGLSVIGLESSAGHSEGAERRAAKQGLRCSGVRSIPFLIMEEEDNVEQFCKVITGVAASIQPCQHSPTGDPHDKLGHHVICGAATMPTIQSHQPPSSGSHLCSLRSDAKSSVRGNGGCSFLLKSEKKFREGQDPSNNFWEGQGPPENCLEGQGRSYIRQEEQGPSDYCWKGQGPSDNSSGRPRHRSVNSVRERDTTLPTTATGRCHYGKCAADCLDRLNEGGSAEHDCVNKRGNCVSSRGSVKRVSSSSTSDTVGNHSLSCRGAERSGPYFDLSSCRVSNQCFSSCASSENPSQTHQDPACEPDPLNVSSSRDVCVSSEGLLPYRTQTKNKLCSDTTDSTRTVDKAGTKSSDKFSPALAGCACCSESLKTEKPQALCPDEADGSVKSVTGKPRRLCLDETDKQLHKLYQNEEGGSVKAVTEMSHKLHLVELEKPPKLYVEETQMPHKLHVDEKQMPHKLSKDETQMPHKLHMDETQMPHKLHNNETQMPPKLHLDETQMPHKLHVDETQMLYKLSKDETQMPHKLHMDETQMPHKLHNNETQMPPKLHLDETQMPHKLHVDETQMLYKLSKDETQMPHKPHVDETEMPHKLNRDETLIPCKLHLNETQTPHKLHGNETQMLYKLHLDEKQMPPKLHPDETQIPHKLHKNETDGSAQSETEKGGDSLRVCLIGLHCCGDLTPAMLRLYHRVSFLRAVCCVSCCYHKMQPGKDSLQFSNFPMSAEANAAYAAVCSDRRATAAFFPPPSPSPSPAVVPALQTFLTPCSLRLAAQETRTRWAVQSEADHDSHARHVGYRAVLELFFRETTHPSQGEITHPSQGETTHQTQGETTHQSQGKTTHPSLGETTHQTQGETTHQSQGKTTRPSQGETTRPNQERKSVRRLDYGSTFDRFVESYMTSAGIVDMQEQQAVHDRLNRLYENLKPYFAYIEPYTCLQVILQPVLESVILQDRQQWLIEQGLSSEVVPVFDAHLSPRNLALVSFKP